MAALAPLNPIAIEEKKDPAHMSITEIRRHAVNSGHPTSVWRMKKADILDLLNGVQKLSVSESEPPAPPKLVRQVAQSLPPTVQEESKAPKPARGVNLRFIRADCKKLIASCENPQVLLHVFNLLGGNTQ